MKFTATRKEFWSAFVLAIVGLPRLDPKKPPRSQFYDMKFQANAARNEVTMTTTDTHFSVVIGMSATVEESGSIVLNAHDLKKLLLWYKKFKHLEEGWINFETITVNKDFFLDKNKEPISYVTGDSDSEVSPATANKPTSWLNTRLALKVSFTKEKKAKDPKKESKIVFEKTLKMIFDLPKDCKDYPLVETFVDYSTVKLSCGNLRKIIRKIAPYVGSVEFRKGTAVDGVNFKKKTQDTVECAATDGHSFAFLEEVEATLVGDFPSMGFVLDSKHLTRISALLSDIKDDKEISIQYIYNTKSDGTSFYSPYAIVTIGENRLVSVRQLSTAASQFPVYEKILPSVSTLKIEFTVDGKQLRNSMDLLTLFSSTVSADILGDELKLHSQSELGQGWNSLSIQNKSNEDYSLAFNGKYVFKAICHLFVERIIVRIFCVRGMDIMLIAPEQQASSSLSYFIVGLVRS